MNVRVVLGLLLISLLVVVVQNIGFYKYLRLDDPEKFNIVAVDDRLQGGKSIGEVKFENGHYVLYCEIIRSGYQWPFCEARFEVKGPDGKSVPLGLGPNGENLGIDLTEYSEVIIAARYREDKSNERYSLRFQARNYHPDYSNEKVEDKLKYNGIEYRTGENYPTLIEYDSMQVLSWWIAENAIPVEQQKLDMSNIHFVELATGNYMRKGLHIIDIESIKFRGKWVSDATAYLALVIMWMAAATIYLLRQLAMYRKSLTAMAMKQKELKIINKLLDSQSKELELKANRDALTGALNRAGFDHYMNANEDMMGEHVPLSALYLDIDFFKKINDTYGHATGDEVLKQFAKTIDEHTRDSDLLVRWGGEEFVLLLPNTPLVHAARLGEKLRGLIEQSQWPNDMTVTMSIGAAEQRQESLEEFLHRADEALYKAKQTGRNKVVTAEE